MHPQESRSGAASRNLRPENLRTRRGSSSKKLQNPLELLAACTKIRTLCSSGPRAPEKALRSAKGLYGLFGPLKTGCGSTGRSRLHMRAVARKTPAALFARFMIRRVRGRWYLVFIIGAGIKRRPNGARSFGGSSGRLRFEGFFRGWVLRFFGESCCGGFERFEEFLLITCT